MSNIPDKVTQALDDYERYTRSAANAAPLERGQANTFRDLKRAEVEAAIDEAITRGKAEPAPEPNALDAWLSSPHTSASDLIHSLLSAASAYFDEPIDSTKAIYENARGMLERYVSTLEHERADAINRYNSADAERANLEMHLEQAHAEHAQAARDRDEMGRMYAIESNRVTHFESELTKARAEIASLNETLASCDSLKLAEELESERKLREEIKRNSDALYKEFQSLASKCNETLQRNGELRAMFDDAQERIRRLQRERDEARKSAETLREDFTEAERQAKLSAEQVIGMRRAADEAIAQLINASGWLDVLADGYLREDATPKGARNLAERLRSCVQALSMNAS